MSDKYPRGKITADDEGEADLAITVRDRTVIIAFSKPMNWIGMDKQTALAIGRTLIERANEIKDHSEGEEALNIVQALARGIRGDK